MQKLIDKLITKYKIQEIEKAFVQFFVDFNNIKVKNNTLIRNVLIINNQNLEEIKSEIKNRGAVGGGGHAGGRRRAVLDGDLDGSLDLPGGVVGLVAQVVGLVISNIHIVSV